MALLRPTIPGKMHFHGNRGTTGRMAGTHSTVLFNSIPTSLRGLDNNKDVGKTIIETFKKDLNEYLKTVRDNPGSHNNSLVNICMKKGFHHSGT